MLLSFPSATSPPQGPNGDTGMIYWPLLSEKIKWVAGWVWGRLTEMNHMSNPTPQAPLPPLTSLSHFPPSLTSPHTSSTSFYSLLHLPSFTSSLLFCFNSDLLYFLSSISTRHIQPTSFSKSPSPLYPSPLNWWKQFWYILYLGVKVNSCFHIFFGEWEKCKLSYA